MVAWQIQRGSGGCLSFEKLNSMVPVLSALVGVYLFSVMVLEKYSRMRALGHRDTFNCIATEGWVTRHSQKLLL